MSEEKKASGLLSTIKVLDLADERASFCSRLLADLGARVIKIEKPGGDESRKIGPFLHGSSDPEKSFFFFYNNANKLGITLDLELAEGRSIFLRLVEKNDIVIETFPPGYLKKKGLSFERLKKANRKLILASITGFGQDGPWRAYKSCDLVASAFGGQMYVSGSSSMPPLKPFGEQSFYVASLFAAVGILLALRRLQRDGKGEHLDISLQESVVASLDDVMVRYFFDGIVSTRQGNLQWNNTFYIFPCKDGFIHLTLFQQWETLIEWIDSDGMAEDLKHEKWQEEEYRRKHIKHIIDILTRWTKTYTVKDLFERGQLMRFPWAPVQSPMDLLTCPQLRARDFFASADHPEIRTAIKYPGMPYKMSASPPIQQKRAPLIGEDNVKVYCEELGISEKEVGKLSSQKVI